MLAAAALVAGLLGQAKAVRATTEIVASPALEVAGRIDGTGVSLDPVYDVSVPPAELVRPAQDGALLTGYAADGRRIFAIAVAANGPFHIYVPLAPASQRVLARITLSNGAPGRPFAAANGPADPAAEIISLDDHSVIVAWNASAFPEIRVRESPDGAPIATGDGSGTYEQISVDTRARRLYIEFSDGVRSTARAFSIFGR